MFVRWPYPDSASCHAIVRRRKRSTNDCRPLVFCTYWRYRVCRSLIQAMYGQPAGSEECAGVLISDVVFMSVSKNRDGARREGSTAVSRQSPLTNSFRLWFRCADSRLRHALAKPSHCHPLLKPTPDIGGQLGFIAFRG